MASGLTTLQGVAIFVGIPTLIFGLIALPFYLPVLLRRRRAERPSRRSTARTDARAHEERE